MDSERQGLLNAIVSHPDNDLPRLVYADWLEDQGDPQSEFIRIQCEMAQLERWEPAYERLDASREQLEKKHAKLWRKQAGVKCRSQFERGLLTWMTLSGKAMAELDPVVFQQSPITSVQLTHLTTAKLQLLHKSGMMKHVRGLKFSASASDSHILSLLQMAPASLRRLDFSGRYQLSPELAIGIAQSKFAKRLQQLYMRACEVPELFFKALANGGGLPGLQRLEFGGGFSVARPVHLGSLKLHKVRQFRIGGKLRVVDVQQLLALPLKKLTHLNMRGTRPPAKGLKLLFEAGGLNLVQRINFDTCNLSRASLELLLQTGAKHCTHLNLQNNANVDLIHVRLLADSGNFPNLKAVNVRETGVDDPDDGESFSLLPFVVCA
ncbi:TIGR02996 domain-containing protein [bacterium]|nr:TIGR02996 domain-containing protein [bacterium]